ncbi:MAG TPA: hypothetical protein VIL69_05265 [Roseomonas sp.]
MNKFKHRIRAFGCDDAHTFTSIERMLHTSDLGLPEAFPQARIAMLGVEKLGSELRFTGFIGSGE